MSIVKSWAEPKTACELGRLIEVFLLAELGKGCSGGTTEHGADLDVDLEDEDVSIFVIPTGQASMFTDGVERICDGYRLEWLDDDEQKLIEAYRAGKRANEHLVAGADDRLAALVH